MADQNLAQDSTLIEPSTQNLSAASKLFGKIRRSWCLGRCWIRYRLAGAHRNVRAVADFVLGNHFFHALQVPSELTALGEVLASRRPKYVLEIGTAFGGTLFFLTRLAPPQATIVSVDLPGGRFGGGYSRRRQWFYQRFARCRQRLVLLQGDSHSKIMLDRVKTALCGQPLDYLFIDGDHTYDGVKMDFEMYAPMVQSGGIIVLHDIVEHPSVTGCEVSEFWDHVKRKYRYAEIIESRTQGWAGIGVLYVD